MGRSVPDNHSKLVVCPIVLRQLVMTETRIKTIKTNRIMRMRIRARGARQALEERMEIDSKFYQVLELQAHLSTYLKMVGMAEMQQRLFFSTN